MRKGYDYKIVTKKLNRPLGDNHYVAMLESLMRINESGPPTSLPTPGLGGQLGRTKRDAYRQMVKVIKKWLAENS